MRRRQALLLITGVGLSGCITTPTESSPTEPTREPSENTSSSSQESWPESKGPVRGENEVNTSIRVNETDASVEYFPENDSVRFVSHRSGDSAAKYTTRDFKEWAKIQCASAAKEPAMRHVEQELGEQVGGGVRGEEVTVTIATHLNREGNVTSRPDISFEELVAATPKTIEVTYALEDREHTCEVPVYAEHRVWQDDLSLATAQFADLDEHLFRDKYTVRKALYET